MTFSHAIAGVLVAGSGLIDQLELCTEIPKSEREFLAVFQAKLGSKSTRKDEDHHFLQILTDWMIHRHRITA